MKLSPHPWKPEYPGQREPAWVWWTPGEYDDDLAGFHTRVDRNEFKLGLPGPFRRRFKAKDTTHAE